MDRIKLVLREPALLIDALETGLVLLVALGFSLSDTAQTDIVAAVIAAAGLLKGLTTHPWPVTVFTDFTRAALVLAFDFGLEWASPDRVALVATFVGTVITVIARAQIAPVNDPVAAPTGAGAGPVNTPNEAGYALLSLIGGALVLLAFILLVIDIANGSKHVSWVLPLILGIIGVALIVFDRSRDGRTL